MKATPLSIDFDSAIRAYQRTRIRHRSEGRHLSEIIHYIMTVLEPDVIGPCRPKGASGMDTRMTTETIEDFFKALENPREKPTQWELEFLVSIRDQFDRRGSLSSKQFDILERIYAERT